MIKYHMIKYCFLFLGRFTDSHELSELVYSSSNLLVLLNDGILRKEFLKPPPTEGAPQRLKNWLGVLESLEVFIEIGSARAWGDKMKWAAILVIQLLKACLRIVLLLWYKSGIQTSSPVTPLDREGGLSQTVEESHGKPDPCFVGRRSSRAVRSLDNTPSGRNRFWRSPQVPEQREGHYEKNGRPSDLGTLGTIAEAVHVLRPVTHFTLRLAEIRSVRVKEPSLTPTQIQGASKVGGNGLSVLRDLHHLSRRERGELRRRTLLLLYYLLRSPFYNRYTEIRLLLLLRLLADYVPGLGLVARPLMDYLPVWQKIYFYNWG
ncbi:hypothetical protein GDO78_003982 [Eleutherodactylus coqui]|uniref:Peroxisomal membrane protein PEX16 n=1 Tax=Eleutherodactylus coqui TaxID=57060 RepID=A0A8J6EVY1_ELECQ|nr:hypothetical protein GDO78_003982 [Eleutherodactylus coqui]